MLSGRPVPEAVAKGTGDGYLSQRDSKSIMDWRAGAVTPRNDGTVLAHGVLLGPFVGQWDGRPRSEIVAERLSAVPSSAYRGARADGSKVLLGATNFDVTASDAAAMGAKSATEGAKAQAALVDGTWVKGAFAEAGRRVMPATLSSAALFEFARGAAEGPGHVDVSTAPGQVTVVGLRGVSTGGVYDPKLKAADDTIVALVVDRSGRRRAVKLSGTVDPGGSSDGATQVGDATQDFYYSNQSGNKHLSGTTLLRPVSGGIEGKDLNKGVQSFDEMSTKAYGQGATLIHLGTAASQSRGCTVIIDQGTYATNKSELTELYKLGLEHLDESTRDCTGSA